MTIFKFKKYIDKLSSVSLSKDEKMVLRAEFLNKTGIQDVGSAGWLTQSSGFRYARIVAYSFLMFMIGITPFAFAAEGSNPGDILYPLKVAVNAPVKKALARIIDIDEEKNKYEHKNDLNKKEDESSKIPVPASMQKITKTRTHKNTEPLAQTPEKIIDDIDSTLSDTQDKKEGIERTIDSRLQKTNDTLIADTDEQTPASKETEKKVESTMDKVIKNIDLSL